MESGTPAVHLPVPDTGDSPTSRGFSPTGLAICVVLFLGTCAAYIPASRLGFIALDDMNYVGLNKHVQGGFTADGVKWAFVSYDPDNWFPVTRLSHMLDYALFGSNAPLHHDVSILFHALASLMLYLFLARATRQRWPSAFVAAIFAFHPLHVESVAWISERKDVLCAFFWFSTLWAWVRYTERPSALRYIFSLLLFAAGLMSKPMIVTLPLLLAVLDIWPLRRPFSRKNLALHLPFWALSAAAATLTVLAQKNVGAVRSLDSFPLGIRVENALATVFIYIEKTFWPTGLAAQYGWRAHESLWLSALAALGLACISTLVVKQRSQRPYLAVGWFWFLITLLPVIGLVQVGPQARADRYMYVPMTGLLIIVAWGCAEIPGLVRLRRPGLSRAAIATTAVAGCAVCLCFASVDWTQESYWESMPVLLRHAVVEDDQNYLAWNYLGNSAFRPAELNDRIECYRIAADLRPDMPELHLVLGEALLQANRVPEAVAQLETAQRISPGDTSSRCLLGMALLRSDRIDDAITQFELAVRNDPTSAIAHGALGIALWRRAKAGTTVTLEMGRIEKELERAIELHPGDPLTLTNLGLVLLDSNLPGAVDDARQCFIHALAIAPDYVAAHLGLARALQLPPLSNPALAADHLEAARKLEPDPELRRHFEAPLIDVNQSHNPE